MKNPCKHSLAGGLFFALPFLIAGCSEETIQPALLESYQVCIDPSSHIQTRVSDNHFEKNDAIGLYLLQQPNQLTDNRHADNIPFYYNGTSWTTEQPLFYPNNSDLCDFIAYYPYQSSAIPAASADLTWNIAPDQSNPKNYTLSDLLVSERLSVTPSAAPVNLVFKHKLAEIRIELEPGNGFDSPEDLLAARPTVTILNASLQGEYNLSTRSISNHNRPGNITPAGSFSIKGNKLIGESAILLPQTIAGDKPFIEVKANDKTFVFTFGENHTIQPATRETYTLTIQKSIPQSTISTEISDWENSSSIQGDLKEEDSATEKPEPDSGNYSFNLPDFSLSAIYQLTTPTGAGLELCKEYLHASNITSQAIVAYPLNDGKADLTQGCVLQLIESSTGKASTTATHGGKVTWETTTNTLNYQAGDKSSQNTFYFNSQKGLSFEPLKGANPLVAAPTVITDNRDRLTYPIVKIATQYWMQSELKATQTQDGKLLKQANTNKEWDTAVSNKNLAYCVNNGYYYYTNAAAKSEIAPIGWKLPAESDWKTLTAYVSEEPSLLASWAENTTGFSANSTFYRKKDGTYSNGKNTAYYWHTQGNITIFSSISTGNLINEGDCIRCIRK